MGRARMGYPQRTRIQGLEGDFEYLRPSLNDRSRGFRWGVVVPRRRSDNTTEIPSLGFRKGTWTVLGYAYTEHGYFAGPVCRCDCGEGPKFVSADNFQSGKSSGCNKCAKQKTIATEKKFWGYADICPDQAHRTRLLNRISSIQSHCNPAKKSKFSKYYAGRGITLCADWTSTGSRWAPGSIEPKKRFLLYLMSLPGWDNPALEIDRINNDGNYEPGNLRFATRKQNHGNRRNVSTMQAQLDTATAEIERLRTCLRSCQCGTPQSLYGYDL